MIEEQLAESTCQAIRHLYKVEVNQADLTIQRTRREFEGDITLVVFPLTKISHKSPEITARELGDYITGASDLFTSYQVIKGFLNFVVSTSYWKEFFLNNFQNISYGTINGKKDQTYVVEFSSPNTNKPLHLGHIRNNLLGYSISGILVAAGKEVIRVNLVNDRGIHVCKSMLAWKKWGGGETPEGAGIKGDHLIGKYYVLFEARYRNEVKELTGKGMDEETALMNAPLMLEAKELLKKWEEKDEDTIVLWKEMNQWAYEGFDKTYRTLGVSFDKTYYESDTYLLGKELVREGVKKAVFRKKEDGSVWADLTSDGLDEKLLLRGDGTSVYITQDLGTAQLRYDEFNPDKLIYVVGNEQNYHFDVLKLLLKHLGRSWADDILHLSYGMVELPQGRMKSREGTVVDADDLMEEMFETARETTQALGKVEGFSDEEANELYRTVGLGALKYYILKVDPKKTMLFNPEESIDFEGNTGPFVQYTYARIQSVLRKAKEEFNYRTPDTLNMNFNLLPKERDLLKLLYQFPSVVLLAGETLNPALVANYTYELAKEFNQFYHDFSILHESDKVVSVFRTELSRFTGQVIKAAMGLLGIDVPERM